MPYKGQRLPVGLEGNSKTMRRKIISDRFYSVFAALSLTLFSFRPQLAFSTVLSNRVFLRPVLLVVFAYQEPWRHVSCMEWSLR